MSIKIDTFTENSDITLPSHISDSGIGWNIFLPSFFLTIDSSLDELKNATGFYGPGFGLEVLNNADYFAEISGKTGGASINDSFGCILRAIPVSGNNIDFYYGSIDGAGKWQISILNVDLTGFAGVPNSVSNLLTGSISGFNANTFYLLRLSISGNKLILSIDNSQVGTVIDNTLTAAGFLGLGIGGLLGNGSFNARITSFNSDFNIASIVNPVFRYKALNRDFKHSASNKSFKHKALNKNFKYSAEAKKIRYKALNRDFRYK